MLTILVRSVILFAVAVVAMRAMGKRQVGQLQPYEMVVVIMIAELAATPMGGVGIPLLHGILPMAALLVCHGIISALCMKSERFRALMCGQPTVLVRNGVLCEKELKRMSVTLDDLMEAMRTGGIIDPNELGTAVLEPGGQVNVFPKAPNRPVTPEDLTLSVTHEGLPLPLILDGVVQQSNLSLGKLTEAWLIERIRSLGYGAADEVLFLCVNTKGQMLVQGKGRGKMEQVQALPAEKAVW